MRILMLNYEFPPLGGGAANANYYLLKEFSKKKDLEIDLITSSAKNMYEIEKFSDNITLYRLNVNKRSIHYWTQREILIWTMNAYRLSKKLTKKNKYDYVHAWFGFPSGFIASLLKIPYLVALRGSDVPGYNSRFDIQYFFLKPLIKRTWKKANKVVANSEGLKRLALKTSPKQEIHIIHNGVDVNEFKPRYNRNDKLKLLCVSRLIERKGIRYLIKAMKDVNAQLTIIGEGNQENELKKLVNDLDLSKKVRFLNYIPHDEIKKYYQEHNVFILPSLNEGMSNTVLEAMASGLALIITDTGGTKELIDGNGYIIEKKSVQSIINALKELNTNKIIKFGKKSRKLAEKMSWETIAEKYLGVYNELA